MAGINFRRLLTNAALGALVIIYTVLFLRMITSPAERTGADFITFYAAGRISLERGFAQAYLPSAQQSIEETLLGFAILPGDLNPFVHPPFILPLLALIALLPYVPAFVVWALLMLGLLLLCAWLLLRCVAPADKWLISFAGIALFYPAFVSLLNGQDSAILVLGGALWLSGLLRADDRLAGIGLGLMTIRPHLALLLALPFLFRRRQVWWWFLISAGLLVVFSVLLLGMEGTKDYIAILGISGGGEGYKINEVAMVNFIGLLRRLFPALSGASTRLAGWSVFAAALFSLCILWWRTRLLDARHFGLAVLVALFCAPHLHYHDLALLLVPILCLALLLSHIRVMSLRTALLLPLGFSLLLLFGSLIPGMKFNLPLLLMLLVALVLISTQKMAIWRSKKDEIPS